MPNKQSRGGNAPAFSFFVNYFFRKLKIILRKLERLPISRCWSPRLSAFSMAPSVIGREMR
jgi:hypothetical protein